MDDKKCSGTVRNLVEDKGFGFLDVKGYEKNVFFHAKDCRGVRFEQLRRGDSVEIGSIVMKERGYVACDVSLVV